MDNAPVGFNNFGPAAAGVAGQAEQINGFLARLYDDKQKETPEKKAALEFVVSAIRNPGNGVAGPLGDIADDISNRLFANETVDNIYDDAIRSLEGRQNANNGEDEEMDGARRHKRRSKKSRKPKRKTRSSRASRKAKRYTRRR